MRRSARRSASAASEKQVVRSDSPSASEVTLSVATPSVSPVPEVPKRQYGTPGQRADGNPKRPMNAFILFSNEKRSELADMNPHLSNAAVSILLGQRWRDMHSSEKSGYVAAARKIKEQFHADHPDAKTRCVSRKGKRKHESGAGGRGVVARNFNPPSLHALALVGSRLNQSVYPPAMPSSSPYHRSSAGSSSTWSRTAAENDDFDYDCDEDLYDDERDDELGGGATSAKQAPGAGAHHLTLLEQLCTVAENEHTAAAEALSAFGAC